LTLLDAFQGRRQLLAYYFMWSGGHPASEQCEGCTYYTNQVGDLSYLHSRSVTHATFCQGSYEESARYREFMGWDMPWYSAQDSLDALLVGRMIGKFNLASYLRRDDRVFETYWTNGRGVETLGSTYSLLDRTIYGRQEDWEDSPPGWPRAPVMSHLRTAGRPPPSGPALRPDTQTTSTPAGPSPTGLRRTRGTRRLSHWPPHVHRLPVTKFRLAALLS
jgi:hypothetical protein